MKILINNLFNGVLQRGIVNYTRNLSVCLSSMGQDVKMLNSDFIVFSSVAPRGLFNFAFVFCEQLVVPLMSIFFQRVISPYNSASIILSIFSNKQLLVVHDFIPYSYCFSVSQLYLRSTVLIHSLFCRDVAFITTSVEREAIRRGLFLGSKRYILPNSFFEIEEFMNVEKGKQSCEDYVLLCSGTSKNKDLSGALDLLSHIEPSAQVVVLGAPQYDVGSSAHSSVVFLEKLDISEVAKYYLNCKFVWVHSMSEGFGRSIVEARIAGKRVLASAIPEFLEQADENVYFYRNREEFVKGWNIVSQQPSDVVYECGYNEITKKALESWCVRDPSLV